jgi:hypothetical protein
MKENKGNIKKNTGKKNRKITKIHGKKRTKEHAGK